MNENSNIPYRLDEIAGWAKGKGEVELPTFQRGLVWSAAQIEVLWDSLVRGIPIGTFSLLPTKGNERYSTTEAVTSGGSGNRYFLLDGQQRANAIALGFQPFPAAGDVKSSILWVDLNPDQELQNKSTRKTFFYVTTPARPWGYRIEDANGENRSGQVPVAQWRKALEEIGWSSEAVAKPAPAQLWPVCARLPVPVSCLGGLAATKQPVCVAFDKFPWAKHLVAAAAAMDMSEDALKTAARNIFEKLIDVCESTRVTAMVAPGGLAADGGDGETSEIALYFTRLNRSGTQPSREDLDYSILKSILPELHQIDDCANAKGRMHPARLANLAMLAFLSGEQKDGWKKGLSRRDILDLKDKPSFARYVAEGLAADLETVDEWLQTEGFGLPPYLRTRLARSQPNLYRFLLVLAARMRKKGIAGGVDFARTLVAFCTTLAWFGNDGAMDFSSLAGRLDELADAAEDVFPTQKALGGWMAGQVERGLLQIPPPPAYFEGIMRAAESGDREAVRKAWSDPSQVKGANAVWDWHGEAGRELVLYACRKYVAKTFGDYDPAAAVWNEDSRPWDYDHIVPRWCLKGTYHGEWHELVAKLLNSIGNIAPIPFGANRSKNNAPPGEVSLYAEPENASDLFVDFGLDGREPRFVRETIVLEDDKEAAFEFARVTARRLVALYREWWDALAVGKLLGECFSMKRMREIGAFETAFGEECALVAGDGIRVVYNAADGTQQDVEENWDWARPWISCGIPGWWRPKGSDKRIHCFLARTFQDGHSEMGLRRHPDETTIDGKNEWWVEGQCRMEGDFFAYAASVLSVCDGPHSDGVFEPDLIGPNTDCDIDWDAINSEKNGQRA